MSNASYIRIRPRKGHAFGEACMAGRGGCGGLSAKAFPRESDPKQIRCVACFGVPGGVLCCLLAEGASAFLPRGSWDLEPFDSWLSSCAAVQLGRSGCIGIRSIRETCICKLLDCCGFTRIWGVFLLSVLLVLPMLHWVTHQPLSLFVRQTAPSIYHKPLLLSVAGSCV